MNIKPFSDDLKEVILNKAGAQSSKYHQTFLSTPHVFLATFSLLAANKESERYKKTYEDLRGILNKYGVNGQTFETAFLASFPKGEIPEPGEKFDIVVDREYKSLFETLKRRAVTEKRTMEIEDMILELFTDRAFSIYLIFNDITGSDEKTSAMYDEICKAFKKKSVQEVKDLEEIPELTNLNKWVAKNPQVVVNADEKIKKIEMGLSGRAIRNVILTGPAGCGKSTFVYEFAQRINSGDVPTDFQDKIIYSIDAGNVTAGTRYRGELEEKIMNILNIVKENPNVILFADECHVLFNSNKNGEDGSQSVGNLIKPYITRGEIQMIGCTTNEEYQKSINNDKALASRFSEVIIEEPSIEETKQIVSGLLPTESKFFNKEIQEELVDRIIDMSQKYTLDQSNPRKAITMLESACAYSKIFEEQKKQVDIDAVIESVRLKFNFYISDNKLESANKALKEELYGQDEALDKALKNLEIVEAGVTDITRPLCSMLLYGPTGTGKTQFCKTLAKSYFGSENCLIKLNMGEYSADMDKSKLTGSSSGYVGYDDEPELIKQVRKNPNSVVLFDEIEKASKEVLKVLLSILDEGEMADNKGNRVSFRNTIIVFTTNLGCTHEDGKAKGLGFIKSGVVGDDEDKMSAIKDFFSPEFLGRLDDMIYFKPLTNEIIEKIINKYLKEYKSRSDSDFIRNFTPSKKDIDAIIKKSNINTQGARGVRKALQRYLTDLYFENKKKVKVDA